MTSKPLWLKYIVPCYAIQERRGVLVRYEVQVPELRDLCVGWVEQYTSKDKLVRWRTLTPKLDDWRDNFQTREEAAQDLVRECPLSVRRMQYRRERMLAESQSEPQGSN